MWGLAVLKAESSCLRPAVGETAKMQRNRPLFLFWEIL